MSSSYSLSGFFEPNSARWHLEFTYHLQLTETNSLIEHKLADCCLELTNQLDDTDNDNNNDGRVIQLVNDHEEYGLMQICIQVINEHSLEVKHIRLSYICDSSTKANDSLVFNFDSNTQDGVTLLKSDTLKHVNTSITLGCNSVDLYSYFTVHATLVNEPKAKHCDISICQVLFGPNIDLLNDWLFCHNHSGHKSEIDNSQQQKQQPVSLPFTINQDSLKPVILDRIEQVIYLLTQETDSKVLLESIEDKRNSIYLQRCTSQTVFSIHFLNSSQLLEENKKDDDFNVTLADSKICAQFPLQYCVFGQDDHQSVITEQASGESRHYNRDDKALTKYRMSFDVDWHRIEKTLFFKLTAQLIKSSEMLNRLHAKFNLEFVNDFDIEESTTPTLSVALLDVLHFTATNTALQL